VADNLVTIALPLCKTTEEEIPKFWKLNVVPPMPIRKFLFATLGAVAVQYSNSSCDPFGANVPWGIE
jgi:hypothetical protein